MVQPHISGHSASPEADPSLLSSQDADAGAGADADAVAGPCSPLQPSN